jgi:hypothetical protein
MWLSVVTTIRCSSNSHLPKLSVSRSAKCSWRDRASATTRTQYGSHILYLPLKVAGLYTAVKDAQSFRCDAGQACGQERKLARSRILPGLP